MRRRVVLVDDHALFRAGVRGELGDAVDIVGEAGTVAEAVPLILELDPEVVLLDVHLPDGGGEGVIAGVAPGRPGVKFLALSVSDAAEDVIGVIRAGARGYVMKREALDSILQAVRSVLNGEIYISPTMTRRMLFDHIQGGGEARNAVERLTDRELEVFQLIGEGRDMHQIASDLHLSRKTVEAHRANIKEKLGVISAREVVRYATQWVAQER